MFSILSKNIHHSFKKQNASKCAVFSRKVPRSAMCCIFSGSALKESGPPFAYLAVFVYPFQFPRSYSSHAGKPREQEEQPTNQKLAKSLDNNIKEIAVPESLTMINTVIEIEGLSHVSSKNHLELYVANIVKGDIQPPPLLLNELGSQLQFQGRSNTIETLKNHLGVYEKNFESSKRTRDCCKIPVLAGAPGLGKTKLLLSLPQIFPQNRTIIITYNNGHNPTELDRQFPEAGLCLRILYFGYEKDRVGGFAGYVDDMRKRFGLLLNKLTLMNLLSQLPQDQHATIIGIDEFNYLLDNQYESNQSSHRRLLKEIVVKIGEGMISSPTPILPLFAGTLMQPLSIVFAESSHPYYRIPLDLLTTENIFEIAKSLDWLPQGWSNCDLFIRAIVSIGGLPRLIEFFLKECKLRADIDSNIESWPWEDMLNNVRVEARTKYLLNTVSYSKTLLVDAVLERNVNRDDIVYGSNNETYGELESRGSLVLATMDNQSLYVKLPLLLLKELLNNHPKDLPNESIELKLLFENVRSHLRKLFRSRYDDLLLWLDWESFEIFIATLLSARISLLYYRKSLENEQAVCSFTELFPSFMAEKYTKEYANELKIKLEPRNHTQFLLRFPPSEKLSSRFPNELEANEYFKNVFSPATGGVADLFAYVNTNSDEEESSPLLLIGQTKRFLQSRLTIRVITEEAEKAAKSVDNQIFHLLILFSNDEGNFDEKDLPEFTIALVGSHLRRFIGHTLTDQAAVLIRSESDTVNVNSASFGKLTTIYSIGKKRANLIIKFREEKLIENWDDLISRFRKARDTGNIPKSIKDRLSFD